MSRSMKATGKKRSFVAAIPRTDFDAAGPWTVVVNVEDKNGVVRRGRFLVRIP